MRIREAIKRAGDIRPGTAEERLKYAWVYELEGKVAELMGADVPANGWPEDAELLMPYPYDNIYELYVAAMTDYFNDETDTYANDMTVFNTAYSEAAAWWRRNHRPKDSGRWLTL